MKGKRMFLVGLAIAALSASAAQAATRPDDRAGVRGVGGSAPNPVRPDDRAGPLGIGGIAVAAGPDAFSRYVNRHSGPAALPPDNRARAIGASPADSDVIGRYIASHSTAAVRPDDRAGPLGVGDDVFSRYVNNHPAAVRPDDRGGIRSVGTGATGIVAPASAHDDSFWGAAELAGAAALGAIAVGLLGFALMRRRAAVAALQS